jgi:hypothetical protein
MASLAFFSRLDGIAASVVCTMEPLALQVQHSRHAPVVKVSDTNLEGFEGCSLLAFDFGDPSQSESDEGEDA